MKPCPENEELLKFALGRLPDADFESVATHVETCTRCDERMRAIESEHDELTLSLRRLPEPDSAAALEGVDAGRVVAALVFPREGGSSAGLSFDAGRHYSRLLEEGPCRLGRFELQKEVGVGSFGHVFRARDTQLDRIVAVKIQRAGRFATDDEAKRFLREARGAAPLVHPSIVSLYDTGRTDDGICFLVTEFVAGETLDDRIKRGGLEYRDTATLVAQVADALDYAHQHGVVHRDVKPSNLLIDAAGKPHVTDFGLAKLDSPDRTMTSDGRIMGTPGYMSPEHARGASHQADARTDVYSLGVILYEMLTGERPFQGAKRLLLLQVLEDEPRSPRQLDDAIPRDLETICLKAMSKSPQRRYQSAKALADDLRCYLVGDPIQARPVGYAERLIRWCRKYPFAAALFVGVTLGALAGFGYLRHLHTYFVQEMALDTARQYSNMLEEFNATYSDVRGRFFGENKVSGASPPPLPATLQIELAERISQHEDGMQVRIFSPFSFRAELRPKGEFETQTLREFVQTLGGIDPSNEALNNASRLLERYEFVSIDARPYLKYARGQVMKASCVKCHNTHKDTHKNDWKEGDLAGVLTLTRPLDRDIERTHAGFRGASLLMVSIACILAACGLVFAYRTRMTPRG